MIKYSVIPPLIKRNKPPKQQHWISLTPKKDDEREIFSHPSSFL